MKKLLRYATVAALPLALLTALSAQVNQDQGGITRQQADEMLKELRQIRQLLERPTKPPAPQEEPKGHEPAPLEPESQRRHDEELKKWLEALKDPNPGIAFSATYKLKDLKDLRAAPLLIDTLRSHKDYYTRLGAAVALGELKSADAVPALIEALEDKEDLVQQSAADALTTITGNDPKFVPGLTKKERKAIKETWVKWWKDNEAPVRQRLGQPPK